MTTPFDPYHRWLAIPKGQRPPTFYQLLGITPTEDDPEVIEEAALRQASHVRTYQAGPHAALCTALLNEIGQARAILLNADRRREYDAGLMPASPPPPLPSDPSPWEAVLEAAAPSGLQRPRRGGGATWAAPGLWFYLALLVGAGLLGYWGMARPALHPASGARPVPPKRSAIDARPEVARPGVRA